MRACERRQHLASWIWLFSRTYSRVLAAGLRGLTDAVGALQVVDAINSSASDASNPTVGVNFLCCGQWRWQLCGIMLCLAEMASQRQRMALMMCNVFAEDRGDAEGAADAEQPAQGLARDSSHWKGEPGASTPVVNLATSAHVQQRPCNCWVASWFASVRAEAVRTLPYVSVR